MQLSEADIRALITSMHAVVAEHADHLTELDQAIGDGDHGINMKRGFDAVLEDSAVISQNTLPDALKAMGMKLVMTIGGASGPLFGTLFMSLGKELVDNFNRETFTEAFGAAVNAVAARGKSKQGQKTMLDVLYPVHHALSAGHSSVDIAVAATHAAEATISLQAQRGRASFLGERSIGHMDPGSCSSALLIGAICSSAIGNTQ